jgi:hypothetical protein
LLIQLLECFLFNDIDCPLNQLKGLAEITVMTNRLRSLLPAGAESDPKLVPFVQPAAIQLCSKLKGLAEITCL